jgi:nitric oxide reductase subunit C
MATDRQKRMIAVFLTVSFLFYSFYLYYAMPFKRDIKNQEASEGKLVWQRYNCNACHQIFGLGGYLGPDLTNEYSLRGHDVIIAFMKSGAPSMPVFHMTEKEMNQLVAFLKDVDRTGRADPRTFTIKSNGTIEQ